MNKTKEEIKEKIDKLYNYLKQDNNNDNKWLKSAITHFYNDYPIAPATYKTKGWLPIEEYHIKIANNQLVKGTEVIGYCKKWIDGDFNHNGTRICAYLPELLDEFSIGVYSGWESAYWNDDVECFDSSDTESPTHFMEMPKSPR